MNVGENAEGRSGFQNKEERAGGGDEEVGVRRTPPAPSCPSQCRRADLSHPVLAAHSSTR